MKQPVWLPKPGTLFQVNDPKGFENKVWGSIGEVNCFYEDQEKRIFLPLNAIFLLFEIIQPDDYYNIYKFLLVDKKIEVEISCDIEKPKDFLFNQRRMFNSCFKKVGAE